MMFRSYNTTTEYFLSDYVVIARATLDLRQLDIFTRKNIVFLHVKIYGFSQWQKS